MPRDPNEKKTLVMVALAGFCTKVIQRTIQTMAPSIASSVSSTDAVLVTQLRFSRDLPVSH